MNTKEEFEKRKKAAIAAIKSAYGLPTDESGATLFVSHHLEELGDDYWLAHLGTSNPKPEQVLEILQCVPLDDSGDPEELETLDFTLPGDVTNYVIAVSFDDEGVVDGLEMES